MDVERLAPNPEKKEYGDKAFKNDETRRPTMRGFNIANPGYKKKILKLEEEIEQSEIDLKRIPDRIAVKHLSVTFFRWLFHAAFLFKYSSGYPNIGNMLPCNRFFSNSRCASQ